MEELLYFKLLILELSISAQQEPFHPERSGLGGPNLPISPQPVGKTNERKKHQFNSNNYFLDLMARCH